MKFFRYLIIFLFLISLILFLILRFTKSELVIQKAEFNNNFENVYPSKCFIKFDGKKYLITDVFIYKNKILNEYWFSASEGFAIQKFNFPNEMNYTNEQKPFRFLNYSENQDFVQFNSKNYKISERRKDTVICKVSEKNIILFIDK